MQRNLKHLAGFLAFAIVAAAGAAHAASPCIDMRPNGAPLLTLKFSKKDGSNVIRANLQLLNYDPASKTLQVDDAGQAVTLSLADWISLDLFIEQPPPQVQAALPVRTQLSSMTDQKFPLDAMKVANNVIAFPGCDASDNGLSNVRFEGKLAFDTANNALTVNGTFSTFVAPSPSMANPGIRK